MPSSDVRSVSTLTTCRMAVLSARWPPLQYALLGGGAALCSSSQALATTAGCAGDARSSVPATGRMSAAVDAALHVGIAQPPFWGVPCGAPGLGDSLGSGTAKGEDASISPAPWRPRGVLVSHLAEHRRSVNQLAVAGDGGFLASASDDGTVKVRWHVPAHGPTIQAHALHKPTRQAA